MTAANVSPINVVDIRKRLDDRAATRDGLLAEQQDHFLDPRFSRAIYSMTLAFACYLGIESEQFLGLVEQGVKATSINQGGEDILATLRANLGEFE